MATPVSAAPLAPGANTYYLWDMSTAQKLPDHYGEKLPDEWKSAMIQPVGADLYFRADGVSPTGADGILIADGVAWLFENQRAILDLAVFYGGNVKVQFFG